MDGLAWGPCLRPPTGGGVALDAMRVAIAEVLDVDADAFDLEG